MSETLNACIHMKSGMRLTLFLKMRIKYGTLYSSALIKEQCVIENIAILIIIFTHDKERRVTLLIQTFPKRFPYFRDIHLSGDF